MYIPSITPIDGIDELLKVISHSKLWTARLTELKDLQLWINDNLEVYGTLTDAKALASKAKAIQANFDGQQNELLKKMAETKSQVDEYVNKVKADADSYVHKTRAEIDKSMEDMTRRLDGIRAKESLIEVQLKERVGEQEKLARSQADVVKAQQQANDKQVKAEALKKEYLDKRTAMKQLAE